MSEFPISIHYPIRGDKISIKGNIALVNETNCYPSPYILEELYCRSERLAMYLLRRLRKDNGINTGIPAQNMAAIIMVK